MSSDLAPLDPTRRVQDELNVAERSLGESERAWGWNQQAGSNLFDQLSQFIRPTPSRGRFPDNEPARSTRQPATTARQFEAMMRGKWEGDEQLQEDFWASVSHEKINEALKQRGLSAIKNPAPLMAGIYVGAMTVGAARRGNVLAGGVLVVGGIALPGWQLKAWIDAVEAMKGDRTVKLEVAQQACADFVATFLVSISTMSLGSVLQSLQGARANPSLVTTLPASEAQGVANAGQLPARVVPNAGQLPARVVPNAGQLPARVVPNAGQLPARVVPNGGQLTVRGGELVTSGRPLPAIVAPFGATALGIDPLTEDEVLAQFPLSGASPRLDYVSLKAELEQCFNEFDREYGKDRKKIPVHVREENLFGHIEQILKRLEIPAKRNWELFSIPHLRIALFNDTLLQGATSSDPDYRKSIKSIVGKHFSGETDSAEFFTHLQIVGTLYNEPVVVKSALPPKRVQRQLKIAEAKVELGKYFRDYFKDRGASSPETLTDKIRELLIELHVPKPIQEQLEAVTEIETLRRLVMAKGFLDGVSRSENETPRAQSEKGELRRQLQGILDAFLNGRIKIELYKVWVEQARETMHLESITSPKITEQGNSTSFVFEGLLGRKKSLVELQHKPQNDPVPHTLGNRAARLYDGVLGMWRVVRKVDGP